MLLYRIVCVCVCVEMEPVLEEPRQLAAKLPQQPITSGRTWGRW